MTLADLQGSQASGLSDDELYLEVLKRWRAGSLAQQSRSGVDPEPIELIDGIELFRLLSSCYSELADNPDPVTRSCIQLTLKFNQRFVNLRTEQVRVNYLRKDHMEEQQLYSDDTVEANDAVEVWDGVQIQWEVAIGEPDQHKSLALIPFTPQRRRIMWLLEESMLTEITQARQSAKQGPQKKSRTQIRQEAADAKGRTVPSPIVELELLKLCRWCGESVPQDRTGGFCSDDPCAKASKAFHHEMTRRHKDGTYYRKGDLRDHIFKEILKVSTAIPKSK